MRDLQFLRPLSVGILSERRSIAPHGIFGGSDAKRGENYVVRACGHVQHLGGKNTFAVAAGDRIRILAPGGGGYGRASTGE